MWGTTQRGCAPLSRDFLVITLEMNAPQLGGKRLQKLTSLNGFRSASLSAVRLVLIPLAYGREEGPRLENIDALVTPELLQVLVA